MCLYEMHRRAQKPPLERHGSKPQCVHVRLATARMPQSQQHSAAAGYMSIWPSQLCVGGDASKASRRQVWHQRTAAAGRVQHTACRAGIFAGPRRQTDRQAPRWFERLGRDDHMGTRSHSTQPQQHTQEDWGCWKGVCRLADMTRQLWQ